MRRPVVFAKGLLALLSAVALSCAVASEKFYLRDGDTVVFYGDSITEQNYYTQWVELYTATRFPTRRIHFVNSGVGGDKVSGGGDGNVDERLSRDVFTYKPTVMTIMLGMNDGQYRALDDAITGTYRKGYEYILNKVKANAPNARMTLIGPSAFDDVTRPATLPGGYNLVMQNFGNVSRDLAKSRGQLYVDFNQPVVNALKTAQAENPLAARLLIPDRVHPEHIIHWVMAKALLEGWNAPATVSTVVIDAAQGKVDSAENATVSGLRRSGGQMEWTTLENALPLPLDRHSETFAQLMALTNIEQSLNQEILKIAGLEAGTYRLSIDDKHIGDFAANELQIGINLAQYSTPMRFQAQRASWLIRDRVQAHFVRMRAQINGVAVPPIDPLDHKLREEIHKVVQPVKHVYRLAKKS